LAAASLCKPAPTLHPSPAGLSWVWLGAPGSSLQRAHPAPTALDCLLDGQPQGEQAPVGGVIVGLALTGHEDGVVPGLPVLTGPEQLIVENAPDAPNVYAAGVRHRLHGCV